MHRCRHSGSRRHNHGSRCMYKQCTCGLSPRLRLPWTWPAKSTAPELLFLTQRCSCNMWRGGNRASGWRVSALAVSPGRGHGFAPVDNKAGGDRAARGPGSGPASPGAAEGAYQDNPLTRVTAESACVHTGVPTGDGADVASEGQGFEGGEGHRWGCRTGPGTCREKNPVALAPC